MDLRELVPGEPLPGTYTLVAGILPLSPHRLLVVDDRERALYVLDTRTNTALAVSQPGGGPLEYRSTGPLLEWGSDVAMFDRRGRRFLMVSPSGTPNGTEPMPATLNGSSPRFRDKQGYVYGTAGPIVRDEQGTAGAADSVTLLRYDPADETVSGVARLKIRNQTILTMVSGGSRTVAAAPVPHSPIDAWTVDHDGRIFILRADPLRMDIIDRDGTATPGEPWQWPAAAFPDTLRDRLVRLGYDESTVPDSLGRITSESLHLIPAFVLAELQDPSGSGTWVAAFDRRARLSFVAPLPLGHHLMGTQDSTLVLSWHDRVDLVHLVTANLLEP